MKLLSIQSLAIPEILVLRFARFSDSRGYFTETYRVSDIAQHPAAGSLAGVRFVQANESYSRAGVIRGLHFQWNPYMGKLVRTISGRMIDLVADIRPGSATFGKVIAFDMPSSLDAAEGTWIWVPPGFAHGNLFRQPTQIEYLCSGEYSPGCEACISPLAPDLDWSLCDRPLKGLFDETVPEANMTDKDRQGLTLLQWKSDPRSENFRFGCC
ncbi:MAG: dTDP-4-dehydrorhamnose 3,5-epimerase [Thermoguttaceae bacterium]|jgi:dTDP-4-dehydrorhamnose 3,5-epimerase